MMPEITSDWFNGLAAVKFSLRYSFFKQLRKNDLFLSQFTRVLTLGEGTIHARPTGSVVPSDRNGTR